MFFGRLSFKRSYFLIFLTTLFILNSFWTPSLFAEEQKSSTGSGNTVENSPYLPSNDPVPYSAEEFSAFAVGARRFDVIFFGSIPLTFMFTTLIYDFSLYAYHEFDRNYGFGTARTEEDLLAMGIITVSVSAVIAIVDIIIYCVKNSESYKKKQEARRVEAENSKSPALPEEKSSPPPQTAQ